MLNFMGVVFGTIVLAWFMFARRPNANKTLTAWRWMLLAWGFLWLVHLFSPIEYLIYHLSISTMLYCLTWLGMFVLGDKMGFSILHSRRSAPVRNPPIVVRNSNRVITRILSIGALMGMAYLGTRLASEGFSNLGQLREQHHRGESTPLGTVVTVFALGGLVAGSIDLSSAILGNVRMRLLSWAALFAYLSVYVFSAGRFALVIAAVCLVTVFIASLQFRNTRYRHIKSLIAILAILATLGVGYFVVIVVNRASGWTGTMDAKIAYSNIRNKCVLDDEFRESLRPFGGIGDLAIEMFYYISPQLYGLEHSLKYYEGGHYWGLAQFHYITRRIETLLDVRILDRIIDQDQWTFEWWGVGSNFFRTAVHSTYIDFGVVFSLPFVLLCGFLAGRLRARAMRTRSPYAIAFQGLVCSGAAFTIIFSPFIEVGWAYPFLWFLVLGSVLKRSKMVPTGAFLTTRG